MLNSSTSSLTRFNFLVFAFFFVLYCVLPVKSRVSSKVAWPISIFDSFLPFKFGTDLLPFLFTPSLYLKAFLSSL